MGKLLLDDLGDYLASGGVGLTVGTNLFLGFLPEQPDDAVAVYETGGRPPAHAMNALAGQAVAEYPRVQVVARATSFGYPGARQRMANIYKLLDGLPTRTINGTQYDWGSAVSPPHAYGRDKQERVLIACSFDLAKRLSSSTST